MSLIDRFLRVFQPPMYVVRNAALPLDQLLTQRPGKVMACRRVDDVQPIQVLPEHDLTGCVAGWISDEDIDA